MIYKLAKCPRQSGLFKSEARRETFGRMGVDDVRTYCSLAYLLKPLEAETLILGCVLCRWPLPKNLVSGQKGVSGREFWSVKSDQTLLGVRSSKVKNNSADTTRGKKRCHFCLLSSSSFFFEKKKLLLFSNSFMF